MRSTAILALAAFLPSTLAVWNSKICNGVGGCVGTGAIDLNPFRCPDGTRLNLQETASNQIDLQAGGYEIATEQEFPTSCLAGLSPGQGNILVKHVTQYKQTMFAWIEETCNNSNPVHGDCYSANPNPSSAKPCQLVDATGKVCIQNPNADECEKWGC